MPPKKSASNIPPDLPPEMVAQLPEPDTNGLRFTLRAATLTLPTGIQAQLLLQPEEQQAPHNGDALLVTGFLYLPKNDSWHFGDRLMLFGEKTSTNWGYSTVEDKPERKFARKLFSGSTWLEALQEAETYCLTELAKLWKALVIRLQALHSEGEEYYIAHNSIAKP